MTNCCRTKHSAFVSVGAMVTLPRCLFAENTKITEAQTFIVHGGGQTITYSSFYRKAHSVVREWRSLFEQIAAPSGTRLLVVSPGWAPATTARQRGCLLLATRPSYKCPRHLSRRIHCSVQLLRPILIL